MHRQVNVHQAKTQLSRLIQDAADGQEIIIARAGKPVARLIAYQTVQAPRTPGLWKSKVQFAADFDTLPPNIAAAFRGDTD